MIHEQMTTGNTGSLAFVKRILYRTSIVTGLLSTQNLVMANSELPSAMPQNVHEATKEVKKDSELQNIFTGIKVKGFGFARYFTLNGFDSARKNAQSQQYRLKLDVTTGKVKGFSATAGIFFSQGSSTPDAGGNTDSAVQGGRGTAYNDNFSDRFNIGQIYASKEFVRDSWKAAIDVGKINIASPLSDKKVDLGTGIVVNAKQKVSTGSLSYYGSFFDSWSGDHVGYNIRRRTPQVVGGASIGTNQLSGSIGIGNNFTLLGIGGDFKEWQFKVYGGNIWGFMDIVSYGDVSYKMKLSDSMQLVFLAQTSLASLSRNARLELGFKGNAATSKFDTELSSAAQFRGIYNLQTQFKIAKSSLSIGYLGSFGDGYGVLVDYKGGISTGGKVWNGNLTATYEGLGLLGSGSFNNSSINVAYMVAKYGFKIPLQIGLDIAYIFGNTNMPHLKASSASPNTITHSTLSQQFIWNAAFVEITPSINYKFTNNLEISFFAATFLGDIEFLKTRTELQYTF
ncbi:hypothetical protein CQA66_05485 [Helicobacter aurati]|uniref:Uncharacterized protein n=1 Tax=Helicobacter aurati TaxID=137778 RepID=A0A3D8J368_9HELI|nr:hypothetical protein [Helicobacter aurati]RDU71919.1 hypothetical protein CQA66_05485 [Helicobacter aurati]